MPLRVPRVADIPLYDMIEVGRAAGEWSEAHFRSDVKSEPVYSVL